MKAIVWALFFLDLGLVEWLWLQRFDAFLGGFWFCIIFYAARDFLKAAIERAPCS